MKTCILLAYFAYYFAYFFAYSAYWFELHILHILHISLHFLHIVSHIIWHILHIDFHCIFCMLCMLKCILGAYYFAYYFAYFCIYLTYSAYSAYCNMQNMQNLNSAQPVPKADRKCCIKFWTTPSVRTGFPALIQHSLSEHLKCLKPKTWNDLTLANLFFLERKMRSAAKWVEQSLGCWYLSRMEWFSLRPRHFYA